MQRRLTVEHLLCVMAQITTSSDWERRYTFRPRPIEVNGIVESFLPEHAAG